MSEIPQDIQAAARFALEAAQYEIPGCSILDVAAVAIASERERCASLVENAERRVLDDKGGKVPVAGRMAIANAIRSGHRAP